LAARGFKGNDLTDAALNPVTHFKSQLGGTLDVTLVLQSRRRTAFKVGTAVADAGWAVRGGLSAAARRLLGKKP
jgi:hypothetical protein